MDINNLFVGLSNHDAEKIDTLIESKNWRLERIVSAGHTTPLGEYYDQVWDEWVVLLTGSAEIAFLNPGERIALGPGDHLLIPAHRPHRVEATDPDEVSIWLALHHQNNG